MNIFVFLFFSLTNYCSCGKLLWLLKLIFSELSYFSYFKEDFLTFHHSRNINQGILLNCGVITAEMYMILIWSLSNRNDVIHWSIVVGFYYMRGVGKRILSPQLSYIVSKFIYLFVFSKLCTQCWAPTYNPETTSCMLFWRASQALSLLYGFRKKKSTRYSFTSSVHTHMHAHILHIYIFFFLLK